jgi:putative endonuclease
MAHAKRWKVYLVRCADGTFYCGITNDLARRVREHNEGKAGAKYTRARRPVTLAYAETRATKGAALAREYAVKRLTRAEKACLVRTARAGASPHAGRRRRAEQV